MQVNITARHLELTPALASYVHKKIEKCEHFFDHLVWAQVILSVEKYRQVAELVIHASKITFRSKEESTDMYAAIDLAVDKMDKQLRKHKEISKTNRKSKSAASSRKRLKSATQPATFTEPETGKHLISEVKRFSIKPSSVQEAVDEMELLGHSFFMFLNAETSQINVIYKRDNGSLGLIEPEME